MTVQRRGFDAVAVSGRATSLSLGSCVLPVWVDGVRAFDADLDRFPLEWIGAMEVYHGISTPIQYGGGPAGVNSCGVVLIWTR